ncbi:MAG: acyl carrier protein, partial [Deltaproteobacteria bacterium]|nr:acyl carrier protein [Deltaproteobacteria bacterium]
MTNQINTEKPTGDPVETTTVLLKIAEDLAAELHPRQAPLQPVMLDTSLDRDLGLDSLARVELLARIERTFGVTLSERAFA